MTKRSWSEVAPETEARWQRLSSDVLDLIKIADLDLLAAQRAAVAPEVAPKISEPTYSLRNRFRYWEELIRNLEADWGPTGRYFIDEYINNLDSRDSIDRALAALPPVVTDALEQLLSDLDLRFNVVTIHDDGVELRPWVARLRRGPDLSGRWYRRPRVIPWK